jgi:rfaE bifunctional protein nucleotidyltransferase chain/domain
MFSRGAFLQFQVLPGKPQDNLMQVTTLLDREKPQPETLIVLPELWASGFDYNVIAEHARMTPELLAALGEQCSQGGYYLAGSLVEEQGGNYYNTLYLTGPLGQIGQYRKQHLFSYWREDDFFQAGDRPAPLQSPHGPVASLVCYDLRFPELAWSQIFQGAEVLVVAAQWPKSRVEHWKVLLQARAIENQVYVIACNGCGQSGEVEIAGHSMIIGPDGTILVQAESTVQYGTSTLEKSSVDALRSKFCPVSKRPYSRADADKVLGLGELLKRLQRLRNQGSRVAFTNGCFDILHPGHVDYLEQARVTADCLVLGLNSDASVRRIKGDGRPINSEQDRARVLAGLACVDFVVIFEQDTPLNLINAVVPDVLVKGADWPENEIVGAVEVKAAGGRVERIAFSHTTSTTAVIAAIQSNTKK